MEQQTISHKIELLKTVSLFSNLNEKELSIVAGNSGFYNFKKDEILFNEGELGEGVYIIDDGEIIIQKKKNGETLNIAQFIKGESFGELDLLENKPMTATAIAETDSTILIYPSRGHNFRDVLREHPEISARMLHELLAIIAGRIRNTNKLLSEKSKWIEDLKKQLYNDKLTGLYNRTYLDEEFSSRINDMGSSVALVMIKPDNFKFINDNYGHQGGDKALQQISFGVRSLLRDVDIAVRYRGDEFAVILPDSKLYTAMKFSDKMLSLVKSMDFAEITGGKPLTITASAGIAIYPEHAHDSKNLVKICFDRMFEAREAGGDRVLVVDK
jgi:diguanylate cyclase (GGDEF)-like protein